MPCPRTQQASLPACSPHYPLFMLKQGSCVFWYDSTLGINPRSTDCKADALTTTPSRWLLYLLRLSLLFRTTLCLFFLDIRARVECRTVLFNLFFIVEPLMYFRVCHGTLTNEKLEITNCKQENQIFRYYNSKNN